MEARNESGGLCQEPPQGVERQKCGIDSSTGSAPKEQQQKSKTLRPQSKRASLLRAFLELGDRGMNCFEAALRHHDFVLRSSISDFRRSFGIEFFRRYETVPGHGGSKIDCCRYWLSPEGAAKARALLEAA